MFKLKTVIGYLIGAVLGLLIGAIIYYFQPITWQGSALVKTGAYKESILIENNYDVIQRIYSRGFIKKVAERAKRDEIIKLLSPQDDARLSVKTIKGGESLLIEVSGGAAEIVQISIAAVVMELISSHDSLLNNYLVDIRKEEAGLYLEQDKLSKRLTLISKSQAPISNNKPEEDRLVTGFEVIAIQHALEYKMNRASKIRDSISSANIRPTTLMEPVSVYERRFFSKLWRACLFGALAGIFISAVWIRWGK
jgi:hypothetical protein